MLYTSGPCTQIVLDLGVECELGVGELASADYRSQPGSMRIDLAPMQYLP